jgi:CheY-like chemotaxis protein
MRAPSGSEECAGAQPGAATQPGRRLRVLIIEDHVDAAETLGDLLTLFGHEAEIAHSGPAGLELARRGHPDVVLCDIGLPEMDGYSVARELRADAGTAISYLVAITGYGRDADRDRAAKAGFDLHLVKPVAPEVLRGLLAGLAEAARP